MGRLRPDLLPDSPAVARNGAVISILLSLLLLGAALVLARFDGWYRIGTYVLGVFGGMGIATALWTLIGGQGGRCRE